MKRAEVIAFSEQYDVKKFAIFSGLNDQERAKINGAIITQKFTRGELLYNEGNRINGTYVVAEGVIKIFKTGSDGKDQIIRFAKTGELVGFRSVIFANFLVEGVAGGEDHMIRRDGDIVEYERACFRRVGAGLSYF